MAILSYVDRDDEVEFIHYSDNTWHILHCREGNTYEVVTNEGAFVSTVFHSLKEAEKWMEANN